jgi:hypothetical protein
MTSIANSCFVRSLACPLCTIQLETQILHCNPFDLSSCHSNIYTRCMEIDDNISIVDGGLDTVERCATENKGCGMFLGKQRTSTPRLWAYSEWRASKDIVDI